jgi:hypothetical protein
VKLVTTEESGVICGLQDVAIELETAESCK